MFEARTCTNVVRPRHPEPRAFHEQGPLHAKVVCSRKRRWCVQNAFVREQTPVPAKPIRSRTNAGACKIHLFENESCRRAHAKGQICLRPGREDRVSQRLTVPQAFATKPYAKGRTGRIASLLHYFRDYCAARDLSGEDSNLSSDGQDRTQLNRYLEAPWAGLHAFVRRTNAPPRRANARGRANAPPEYPNLRNSSAPRMGRAKRAPPLPGHVKRAPGVRLPGSRLGPPRVPGPGLDGDWEELFRSGVLACTNVVI